MSPSRAAVPVDFREYEAAAIRRGHLPPQRNRRAAELLPSMKPRLFAADIDGYSGAESGILGPSMKPRLFAADIVPIRIEKVRLDSLL